jgi:hypothetical protein
MVHSITQQQGADADVMPTGQAHSSLQASAIRQHLQVLH